jgi:hypothetical protein
MNNYDINDFVYWSTVGFLIGQYTVSIIYNENNNFISKISLIYALIGLTTTIYTRYTDKTNVDFNLDQWLLLERYGEKI